MTEHYVDAAGGRVIGMTDYGRGEPGLCAVLYCHGAPGSRRDPLSQAAAARDAGFRVIGIDRPGYGRSTPQPGRHIGDWTTDARAVADYLGLDEFIVVGVSTGGAYALATAAVLPDRVTGVLLSCAMTDMRWAQVHSPLPNAERVWASRNRNEALSIAFEDYGADGGELVDFSDAARWPAADLAFMADPKLIPFFPNIEPFTYGLQGIVDDRIADAPQIGWASFDVAAVRCPVSIIHGRRDTLFPVAHAHHIATQVPQSTLQVFPDDGHMSINDRIVPALVALRDA